MENPKKRTQQEKPQQEQTLEELNDRIDKAVARFDKLRRDYRFLAGPNWRESKR